MRAHRKHPGKVARIAQAAAASLCLGMVLSGAYAQQPAPTTTQAPPVSVPPTAVTSTAAPLPATGPQRPIVSFITSVLAGGAVNSLTISLPINQVPEPIT